MEVQLKIDPFYVPSIAAERLEVAMQPGGPTFTTDAEFIQYVCGKLVEGLFDKHKARPTPVIIDGIPQEVTGRQGRSELIAMGLHDNEDLALSKAVQCIKANYPTDKAARQQALSWFLDSTAFLRQNPLLLAVWTQPAPLGFGLPLADLDAAFTRAFNR